VLPLAPPDLLRHWQQTAIGTRRSAWSIAGAGIRQPLDVIGGEIVLDLGKANSGRTTA
jgi:hypothetical protein